MSRSTRIVGPLKSRSPCLRSVAAYQPFAYLALARYQPQSLDGLELSEIVVTEPVPLLPERRIEIERVSPGISVRVVGIGPERANRLHIGLERWDGPGREPDLIALGDAGVVPAWIPMPEFSAEGDATAPPLYVGLPATSASIRVRIRETEHIPAVGVATAIDGVIPGELRERTVLLDHVAIPKAWLR